MEIRPVVGRLHLALAVLLVGVLFWESSAASSLKSPVFDEPPHIAAGLSYVETGIFQANLQHPPLLKELSGVFLRLAGIRWPRTLEAVRVLNGGPEGANAEWNVGVDVIAANGADRALFWARLPFILLAAGLGFLIYWWGRELIGPWAALGAVFLYVIDPTVVAHSFLVTTDVGVTALAMLFLWLLWRYTQSPGTSRLVLCGVSLGAALTAKFSGVVLVPVAAVLLIARAPTRSKRRGRRKTAGDLAGIILIAGVVIQAVYFFSRDPFLYVTGLQRVNGDHAGGFQAYFHGAFAPRFLWYFVAAYLLKEPLPLIALAAFGAVIIARSRSVPPMTKWFMFLTPAIFLAAATLGADDLGIRYIIPALPFLHLCGGAALSQLAAGGGWPRRSLALALSLWAAVNAAGIYPDHLSFFNEAACLFESPALVGWDAGSRCGPVWLDDSNVDWGQGLKQLKTWIDGNAAGRELNLAYFGTYPPENYGIRFAPMSESDLTSAPSPGLYAVTAHAVGRFGAMPGGSWLRRVAPAAIVGHAFYIYEIRRP